MNCFCNGHIFLIKIFIYLSTEYVEQDVKKNFQMTETKELTDNVNQYVWLGLHEHNLGKQPTIYQDHSNTYFLP